MSFLVETEFPPTATKIRFELQVSVKNKVPWATTFSSETFAANFDFAIASLQISAERNVCKVLIPAAPVNDFIVYISRLPSLIVEKQWSTLFLIHTDVSDSDRQLTVWMNSDGNREDGASFNLWRNCGWFLPAASAQPLLIGHMITPPEPFPFPPLMRGGGKKVRVKQTARAYWITQQPLNPAALPGKASVTVGDWGGREKRTTERVHQVGIHSSSLLQKSKWGGERSSQ